ncbi:hypothetical protein GBAR_LOCUS22662 [Geodia barretti]|uniref:Uncharacterized protein n=1 Tax=Geodia barretti TaxID=519541 RepID=A0AA35T3G1_GEOBA|nr:hypothetical protein GBAR_LOCUS22662 [Geodia barretti]
MLKLLGGGGGNGVGKTRWQGKSFQIEQYNVTVEDILAEALVKWYSRLPQYAHPHQQENFENQPEPLSGALVARKALSDSPHSVTYLASSILKISPDVYEVLILLELYTGQNIYISNGVM